MGLFHRSRDKDTPSAIQNTKHQSGFRKSFKKLAGSKPTPPTPEPIATSIHRQSNVSEHSPSDLITKDQFACLEGSLPASESIITTPPSSQLQVPHDETPFEHTPDTKTDNEVVARKDLSNLHIDGVDGLSLRQEVGAHAVKAIEPTGFTCHDITSVPKTLWDRAYEALQSSNDPSKSVLVADYERKVLHDLEFKLSGESFRRFVLHVDVLTVAQC